jgi:hypothetical protein
MHLTKTNLKRQSSSFSKFYIVPKLGDNLRYHYTIGIIKGEIRVVTVSLNKVIPVLTSVGVGKRCVAGN